MTTAPPPPPTPPSPAAPDLIDKLLASPWAFVLSIADAIAALGNTILVKIGEFGEFVRFMGQTFAGVLHPRSWMRRDRIGRQLFFVGTTSVPVLALTGGFIGMILAFEGYRQFLSIGQESRLGGVINLSVVKNIGPVLTAVMLAGRVGCSLTAELGSMKVTEQLDAMRAMGSDPIRVLVVPRFLACTIMIPFLMIVSIVCGVLGGWLITTRFYDADPNLYIRFSQEFVNWYDLMNGLIKTIFYGMGIGLISCWKGFSCRPGAEGVGEATTNSFVTSFITIIIMTLVLAKLLNDIDFLREGGVKSVFA
jgi:phospholipid/cholesterol/gamma-HCH transport system permease protein